ncbi:MAG: DUF1553 domain-containing protein [Planctomycetota bacterium]
MRPVYSIVLLMSIGWLLAIDSRGAASEGARAPSYQREVTALFGKLGCNGGTCHGAVKGQNGFRLSMFAADPLGDHERLLRESGGRRLNFFDPDHSLLLEKAIGKIPHGGGVRLQRDSADYELLRHWIAAGAIADDLAASRLKQLRIEPAQQSIQPGQRYSLRVIADFADESSLEVTALCSFESLDRSVATVNREGVVTGEAVGDAGILVRYRAQPAASRVMVPRPGPMAIVDATPHNFIDQHVLAKLNSLNMPPSGLCDDTTFLRRVSLDVTGQLPAPDHIRQFVTNEASEKRATEIDQLLSAAGHFDLWTLKFCDLLKAADFGVYADALTKEHDAPRMQAWIRARLAENTPYDEFVERILLATSREGRSMEQYAADVQALFEGYAPGRPDLERYAARRTLDLFWQRRGSDGVPGTMQVAHAFLGLRLECAQCHRHPHDNWQQDDLLDFANFFMRVRTVGFQGDNEKKFPDAAIFFKQFNEGAKSLEAEVKARREGEGKHQEESAKQAKADVDRLTNEIAKLEKSPGDGSELETKRQQLQAAKELLGSAESYRQETNAIEKRAKMLPEIARRLLQGECRILSTGSPAKVASTLGTRESTTFRLLGESQPVMVAVDRDPRELVVEWLRRPNNPYFARAIVNRVWAHYFGRGIIDPPDNLSAFNPATHPELLQELCDQFVAHQYDLRWLHRTILNSRTYQQTSVARSETAADRTHYASYPLRRLPAEVLLDALNSATGTTENMDMKYYHWPETISTVRMPYPPQIKFVAFILETFGRPQRNAAVQCDCERDASGSIFQVLTLANHPRVWEKVRDANGRVAQVMKMTDADKQRLDELFLASISRWPTDQEREACQQFLARSDSLGEGLQNILWSLLNTREFLLQH